MAFTVIYDANVLYPAPLRDLLIRLARKGVVQAKWTSLILDEVFRNLAPKRPDLCPERLQRTRGLMERAIPDVAVEGFEPLIAGLELPDPDDRHVLAAAIKSGAQAIVTHNLKDFPRDKLAPYNVEAMDPDTFVLDLLDLAPGRVLQALNEQQGALKRPPQSMEELLETLAGNGLRRSVMEVRQLL